MRTVTAILDCAFFNKKPLKKKSIIVYNKDYVGGVVTAIEIIEKLFDYYSCSTKEAMASTIG